VQSKRVDMTYNGISQMTGLTRFSDLGGVNLVAETSYSYYQNEKLAQIVHRKGANNLVSYNYIYDSASRLTKVISSVDGTDEYTYSATDQLTGANHSNQTNEAYQYDANGNRIDNGYQTGTNNQLLADRYYTYEYDHEGNRTKRTEIVTGKTTEYVWDYRNRLTQVLFKDGAGAISKAIEYTYDVDNQRIGKKIDTSATGGGEVIERYVIDRDQIALVFDGQGVQKSRYLYGAEIDQVLAEESGASVQWFLADEQGTIKDVVDNTGAVIDHISYDSYGRIVNQTNPIELRFAYTGREWDGETGQYYYRARYYDPTVGAFISEDPLGFGAQDTNLRRYVGNSPTNYTDPSGEIVPVIVGGILIYAAQQTFFPDNAQAPMSACDNHPTPPDQELKRELLGLGLQAGAGLFKAGVNAVAAAVARAEAAVAARAEAEAVAAAARGIGCFVAGTEIQTSEGIKNIEDIKVGDWVLSDDPNTPGGVIYKQVLQTFAHDTARLVDIYINGEKITTTEEHPFWVQGVGWVAAKDLTAGAHLQTKTESWLAIDKVEMHTALTMVYNFEVAGFHTYFVSDVGLLVHNSCSDFPKGAWISRSVFNNLQQDVGLAAKNKFSSALQKSVDSGTVGPTNQQGIKALTGSVNGYTHELKINGSAARILGKFDEKTGVLVFDKLIEKGLH
jgi:RHS repeat-associated protein